MNFSEPEVAERLIGLGHCQSTSSRSGTLRGPPLGCFDGGTVGLANILTIVKTSGSLLHFASRSLNA
jgi:hypothetical protein